MALANIEPTMNEVMQYRFEDGALKGQSFGNLFLAAMNGLYGNFETAVYKIGQIFAITGRVLPVTLENIDLIATLENSQVVKGESTIPKEVRKQKCKIDKITLIPEKCRPLDEVISSIHGADIIVMGPGSLYTSVIPNLLSKEIKKTLINSKAKKMYICNIMTEHGETDNFNVSDCVKQLNKYVGKNFIDVVIANSKHIDTDIQEKYLEEKSTPILIDEDNLKKMNVELIKEDLAIIKNNQVRHDHLKTALTIFNYLIKEEDL